MNTVYFLGVKEQNVALVKRETGVIPVRSRRCENGALTICHWIFREGCKCVDVKSEDLPIKYVRKNHEELVRYKAYNFLCHFLPFYTGFQVKGFFYFIGKSLKSGGKKYVKHKRTNNKKER